MAKRKNNGITKWCSACLSSKSLDSFNKDSSKWDGLTTQCRSCRNHPKRRGPELERFQRRFNTDLIFREKIRERNRRRYEERIRRDPVFMFKEAIRKAAYDRERTLKRLESRMEEFDLCQDM